MTHYIILRCPVYILPILIENREPNGTDSFNP
jgi:hypothetical protein